MSATVPYFLSPAMTQAFARAPVAVVRTGEPTAGDLRPPPPSSRCRPRMNTLVGLGDEAIDEQERFTVPFVLIQHPPQGTARAAAPARPTRRPLWLVVCDALELIFGELIARASFGAQQQS